MTEKNPPAPPADPPQDPPAPPADPPQDPPAPPADPPAPPADGGGDRLDRLERIVTGLVDTVTSLAPKKEDEPPVKTAWIYWKPRRKS